MKQNWFLRVLSMVLTLTILLELGPITTLAADQTIEPDSLPIVEQEDLTTWTDAYANPKTDPAVIGEEEELRTEGEKHFRLNDGSYIAVSYGMPVHYADANGEWQNIDNTLVLQNTSAPAKVSTKSAVTGEPQKYTAENGDDTKTFSGNLSSGFLFSVQRGDASVAISLLDGLTVPTEVEEIAEPETKMDTWYNPIPETAPETEATTDVPLPELESIPETTEVHELISAIEETMASDIEDDPLVAEDVSPTTEVTEETIHEMIPENTVETISETTSAAVPEAEPTLETISETVPETEPILETIPATESETESILETIPETTPEITAETTSPIIEDAVLYNRTAAAQISYPNQKAGVSEHSGWPATLQAALNEMKGNLSLDEQITPSKLRTNVLYPDVFPGVDLQYELCSYHTKETIIVKEPLPGYNFSFKLNLVGLTPVLQEDGSVVLLDVDNRIHYAIPAPYMTDANGEYSEAVEYHLTQGEDDAWTLTVTADPTWVEDSNRAFPVCIDPTLIDYTASQQFVGTVCTENGGTVSSKTNLACGYHPEHGRMEIFYKLSNLPQIPAGHTLVRAQAGLYQNDFHSAANNTGEIVLSMCPLTQKATLDDNLTWANRPSRGPVLDYVDSNYSTIAETLYWDVTSVAKRWYEDSSSNFGLVLTSNADSAMKCRTWFSYSNVVLVVSYRSTNGIEDYYTYQIMGLGNAGTAYIGDFSGQLTLCKNLISYSSTVNPVSIDLVYNSSYAMQYGEENYDAAPQLGLGMHLGAGVQLSVMQKVQKIKLQNDNAPGNQTDYMKYTDGDGTIHYFRKDYTKDPNYYYDEDGLGLKINEYRSGCYMISDDADNEMYFVNGFLTLINDANGNEIQIHYVHRDGTSSSNGHPSASGDRISKIVQQNNGCAPITVATFHYDNSKWLTSIEDAAGYVYKFIYVNHRLHKICRGDTVLAQYGMGSTRMSYAYDAEAQYGVAFTYRNGKINSYYEITSPSTTLQPGAVVEVSHPGSSQTHYRDYGSDRVKNGDDILTHYAFDYAGRTVNGYTTDANNKILGASNAIYSGVGSTNKTNNRTLRTASVGVSAMNELRDHGFELAAPEWKTKIDGSSTNLVIREMTGKELTRTGKYAAKGWIESGSHTIGAYRATDLLQPGVTYTLSAYVNTSQCTSFKGRGVYLQVTGNGLSAESECLNYQTSTNIDHGWVKLSVSFTPKVKGNYTIGVYNQGAGPLFYADDFQLEASKTPSNLNLLENGNLQYWEHGWKLGNSSVFCKGTGLFASNEYAYSIRTIGNTNAESHAYQDVPIHKAGNTYVLSGWAKANAVPDNIQKTTGTDAAATDKHKQFGLRAVLTYADGTTEYHYVPFYSDLTDWQYVSMTIVPKKEKEVLEKIRVVCAYERNSNEAWFDNLSLTQEAAQTMKYDKDGHLVSVKSTGKSEESTLYENGDLKKLNTGGNGTFTYEHDKNHNITEASNEIVKENLTYDASGNVTTATISPKKGTDKIVTNNTYTNQGNLLSSVKQRGEFTTTYQYETALHKMLGKPSQVVDARGSVASASYDAAGRLTKSSISKAGTTKATVNHSYIRDMLSQLSRTAGGITQQYNFSYDAFGNVTQLSVGNHTLAQYTYGPKNGQLKRQTYGNKDYVDFSYDNLNRITETRTSSGDSYRYTYTGDGQLYQMEDTADGITYNYNYDTIGRLIGTSQTGGSADLRAAYSYDDSNRLKSVSYSIPGIIDKATETLYYNSNTTDSVSDGALDKMALFSNNWIHYHYDNLSRLTERELGGILTEHQSYLAGKNGCTTTTLPKSFSTTPKGSTNKLSDYQYAYDPLGNIVQANDQVGKTYSKYAYDALGQMQYATDYLANGTAQKRYKYYYDSVGNLTSWKICSGDNTQTFESHTYTYGDADWKDLLTAFDGHSITYDGAGNPLNYYNGRPYSMTWRNGRQLDTVSVDGKTYQYEYDVNGLRTRKTNADGGYTEYYIVNGLTVAEQRFYPNGSTWYVMKYLLDEQNIPVGFAIWYPGTTYWTSYYYGKNLQGDVVNLYRSDPKGNSDIATLVATYRYDPWGKVQGIFKPNGEKIPETAVHVAAYNPFRYRGYRYDGDTGFYYLQSRYYDPEICRFISADSYASTGQGLLGHNMFVYCGNNPVNRTDPSGQFWGIVIGVTLVVGVVAALSGCSSKPAPTSNVGAAQPYVNMPGSSDRNSPNCYAYAIGSPVNEQPGARSGQTPSKWNDVDAVGKCVEADLESMNKTVRRIDGPDAKVYDNEFKIALRVGTKPYAYNQYSGELYYDYHFMRQTDTGQWAEKHGIGGGSVLWDVGMTPDTIPWTLNDKPYYDSPIIYYAVGN